MAIIDNRRVTGYIVDADTGELRQELRTGDRFLPMRLFEPDAPGEYVRLGGSFVKLSASGLELLAAARLSRCDWACLWLLCARMRYNTGEVRHKNGRPITLAWLAKKAGVTELSARRSLERLQGLGFIFWNRGKGVEITINPYFCYRGQVAGKAQCALFEGTGLHTAFLEGQNDKHAH